VVVTGGTPPYRLGGIIPAALNINQTSPDTFVVTPLAAISDPGIDISIFDSVNAVDTVNFIATAGQPTIRLSPSLLTVSEIATGRTFALTLFGVSAGGIRTAFSSDITLLTVVPAAVIGTTFTVTQATKCVAGDTTVTIIVVDLDTTTNPATSTIATAAVTISDNGNAGAANCP